MKLTKTQEQIQGIELVKNNQFSKIDAKAGTGKTSQLVMIAEENPVSSLYLAFNKAMADEAKEKFPSWVEVRTTHSLAYSMFGGALQHKLKRPSGRYVNVCGTGSEIAKYFKIEKFTISKNKSIPASALGLAVKETLSRFESSDDSEISSRHISHSVVIDKNLTVEQLSLFREIVMKHAKSLWSLRINTKTEILANHDTYLKLYQLSKPDLSKFEIIFLDEAQDSNDCILDVIRNQKECKVVLVGDKHQAIYGWRGAINAMEKFDCPSSSLTKSFRFGQQVADVANLIIGSDMKGYEKLNTEVIPKDDYVEEGDGVVTHLYRTNAALINDAVYKISKGVSVSMEVDVKDFVKLLDSTIELSRGNKGKVKHDLLLSYDSWNDFVVDAEVDKSDIGRVYKIVQSNRHYQILGVLAKYEKPKTPDIIMTTAHKSKGREWDVVILADDFPSNYQKGEWVGLDDAEKNLLYVAATRAKKKLVVNSTIEEFMDVNKEQTPQSFEINIKSLCDGESYIRHLEDQEALLIRELQRHGVSTSNVELSEAEYLHKYGNINYDDLRSLED